MMSTNRQRTQLNFLVHRPYANRAVDMMQDCAKSCTACEGMRRKSYDYSVKLAEEFKDPSQWLMKHADAILEESAQFGVKQVAGGGERPKTIEKVKLAVDYMHSSSVANLPPAIRASCINTNELCAFWATVGTSNNNEAGDGTAITARLIFLIRIAMISHRA